MSFADLLGLAAVMALFGLLLLALLWPGEPQGRRLLRTWGVAEPDPQEISTAVAYLKRRRLAYPWLYFLLSFLAQTVLGNDQDGAFLGLVLLTVLLGSLLAELLALRPARGRTREASLDTRRPTDLVPYWALALDGCVLLGAVVLATAGVAGVQWARGAPQDRTTAAAVTLLLVAVLSAVAVALMVLAAVRRPPDRRPRVDLALRVRSARVAIGLHVAVLTSAVGVYHSGVIGLIIGALGITAWVWITAPIRALPAPTRAV